MRSHRSSAGVLASTGARRQHFVHDAPGFRLLVRVFAHTVQNAAAMAVAVVRCPARKSADFLGNLFLVQAAHRQLAGVDE